MDDFRGETLGVTREDASKAVLAVAKAMVENQSDPHVQDLVRRVGKDKAVELLAGIRQDSQPLA